MRIGFLSNTYPPNLNGVSLAVSRLVEGLRSREVEAFVVVPEVAGADYPDYVLPVQSLPTSPEVSKDLRIPYLYISQAVDFFRANKIDLIHTHDTMIGGAEGIVIANRLDIPAMHTYHTFTEQYPYLQIPGRTNIIRSLVRLVCENYDTIITPSSKVYKYLSALGIRSPLEKVYNVTVPIKSSTNLDKQEILAKYGLAAGDFIFTTFCRVAEEKGIPTGFLILEKVLKKYPNVKYLIAGDGPQLAELKRLAKYMNLQDKVIFSGKYTPADLVEIGAVSDVFVFTSKTENLPTNILEAAQLGLPILSVEDESVDYILKLGVNGYKGDINFLSQKALELYQNPKLLEKLGRNSLDSANEFMQIDTVQEHIQLYTKLIKVYTGLEGGQGFQEESFLRQIATQFQKFWKSF